MNIVKTSKFFSFFATLFKDVIRTAFVLFRLMIPVSIIVKLLQMLGFISIIGDALYPIMKYVGLPGEMGLVWATGMITNLFGGIIAFMNIFDSLQLTVAQITIISMMMLVAHTFPIELIIARKSGLRIIPMFLLRFVFAYLFGLILFHFYNLFDLYQEVGTIFWKPEVLQNESLTSWLLSELKNYAIIFCFIFSLMFLLRVLKMLGIIDLIARLLHPFLRFLGLGKEVITIAIVGLTLGIVYGGAMIIDEANNNKTLSKKDIFYALALMGLCHSLIEDTLLMMSLGASFTGVFVFRIILSILVIFILVRLTRNLKEKTWKKYFIR